MIRTNLNINYHMYYFITLFLGGVLLKFLTGLLCLLFGLDFNTVDNIFTFYIIIGYLVMYFYSITSPFVFQPSSFKSELKKIDLKAFFHDIYYAMWWPYYIWWNMNKNNIK